MTVNSFGYASLRTSKIDDWAEFGPKFLGLQLVEKTKSAVKFRMDDRKQRIVVSAEQDAQNVFGWEVDDVVALNALAGRLEASRIRVDRMPSDVARLRAVEEGIRFRDPADTELEAFYGPEVADTPFIPGRPISGFRTGPLGMGHAVLLVENIEDLPWFYRELLGFRTLRLHPKAVQGLFLSSQSASSQPGDD